jgi:hypothetical protein
LGEVGFFLGGLLFSGALLATWRLSRRFFTPTPDAALRLVFRRLADDPLLLARLGRPVQYGEFRAYTYKGGLQGVTYTPRTHQRTRASGAVCARAWGHQGAWLSCAADIHEHTHTQSHREGAVCQAACR